MNQIEPSIKIPDAHLSKFLDDMLPTKLLWRHPNRKQYVFWSEDSSTNWSFQEHIINAISSGLWLPGVKLIQFWAAEMIRERLYLTTTLQPFSFRGSGRIKGNMIKYRKICAESNILVANDGGVEGTSSMDGILGRVFRNCLPEASLDLSYYSVKEYPTRDLALSYGFKSILALPVLEPSNQCCLGVLELLITNRPAFPSDLGITINRALKSAHLETIEPNHIRNQIRNLIERQAEHELPVAASTVCKKYFLPYAAGWVRCARISGVDNNGSLHTGYSVNCEGELLVYHALMNYCGPLCTNGFYFSSSCTMLHVGQGLAGKALLYHKPCLCRDVRQLSITGYPLVHCARKSGLAGCFAVCLLNTLTGNHEYAVEFYLPRIGTSTEDLHSLLSSIVTTMNLHLKTFEVVSGDIENGLFIEINTQLELETLQNNEEAMQSDSIECQEAVEHEHLDVLEQPEIAIRSEMIPPVKQSKAQNLVQKFSCPREVLEQHFGKKRKDASKDLCSKLPNIRRKKNPPKKHSEENLIFNDFLFVVSESTLKRWCREHNISRWPSYKRSIICSSSSSLKQTNVVTQSNVELISQASERNPLCPELATNVVPMPAKSSIMVKIPYGANFIKFKFSYTSRMEDLIKNVIIRTKFVEGTFNITYLDEENDSVLIACDDDLKEYMDGLRLSGETTIEMKIERIVN